MKRKKASVRSGMLLRLLVLLYLPYLIFRLFSLYSSGEAGVSQVVFIAVVAVMCAAEIAVGRLRSSAFGSDTTRKKKKKTDDIRPAASVGRVFFTLFEPGNISIEKSETCYIIYTGEFAPSYPARGAVR